MLQQIYDFLFDIYYQKKFIKAFDNNVKSGLESGTLLYLNSSQAKKDFIKYGIKDFEDRLLNRLLEYSFKIYNSTPPKLKPTKAKELAEEIICIKNIVKKL